MSRESNRAAFPRFAAAMDDVRTVWPEAKVRFIEENGQTLGEPPDDAGLFWVSAETLHHMREMEALRRRK